MNFQCPCRFTTETVDEKGKIRKKHDMYFTPFEKFQSLSNPKQLLKKGAAMDYLREVERQHSNIECTKLIQTKKIRLFRSSPH